MNKPWLKSLSVLILAFGAFASLSIAAPLNDSIVAIVNNDVITLKDLKDYIGGVYRQLKVEHRSQQEIQEIIASYEEKGVNQLIEDKLILESAKEKKLEIRMEVLEKRVKEVRDRYDSEDQFLAMLNSQGMTVTDLKNKLLNQMKSRYMVEIEVKDKVFVNPDSVNRYYNDHAQEFESKAKCNLDSIYIPFDKIGRLDAIKRIQEARRKLVEGASFEDVSKEYSQGPSVGILEQGQMVPAIEQEVFSLKEGDLSKPIEVGNGVYLFKILGITPSHKQSLDEAKEDIYNKVFQLEFQKKYKDWIDKLRKKAYVEIRN